MHITDICIQSTAGYTDTSLHPSRFHSAQCIQVLLFGTFWDVFFKYFDLSLVESTDVKPADRKGRLDVFSEEKSAHFVGHLLSSGIGRPLGKHVFSFGRD